MSTWSPSLWKRAEQLEQTYRTCRLSRRVVQLPVDDWQDALQSFHRLQLAEAHDWRRAAQQQRDNLAGDLERVKIHVESLIESLRAPEPVSLPTAGLLYAELKAIADQFERWEFEEDELVVVTEPVTLEGIDLGPFEIRLELERPSGTDSYRVVALRPNPASSSEATIHPHVNEEYLCPGEGRGAVAAALQEGRLSDFFTIVDRILHTYSPGNAYVDLSRWHGVPCHDCDVALDEDETSYCQGCDHALCGECSISCAQCGLNHCSSCIDRCERCQDPACSGCLRHCARCRKSVCSGCLTDGLCTPCEEELANDEAETATTTASQPAV